MDEEKYERELEAARERMARELDQPLPKAPSYWENQPIEHERVAGGKRK
jgi:hypothetical protein